MIDTSLRLPSMTTPGWASGPKPPDQVELGQRELMPEWMRKRTAHTPVQAPVLPAPPASEEETRHGGRLRVGLMLGLSALGVVAPMVAPAVAHAAPIAAVQNATSVGQVVDQFQADQQVYMVGNPRVNGQPVDVGGLQEMLRQHPGTYVVLVDGSTNLSADDQALSRGIGNHPDFQHVVNPRTGERQGVVFMVYTGIKDPDFVNRTGKDRAIFMRSEELPDRLGVGEARFADPQTGAPRELMQLYIDSFTAGKGLAGSLDAVMDRIDGTVNAYAEKAYGDASQAVQTAASGLEASRGHVADFQRQHGTGGSLGSPDVRGWEQQLETARQALQNKDLAGAKAAADRLNGLLSTWESAASAYGQAGSAAAEVRASLQETARQIPQLEQNGHAQAAAQHQARASRALEEFEVAYRAKDPGYADKLNDARDEARAAAEEVHASQSETATLKNVKLYGSSAVVVGLLVTAFVLNHRARARSKEARAKLDEVTAVMGTRSKELLELLDRADYHKVSNYTGRTRQVADQMLDNANEALMLVGGAEKFLDEAGDLIEGKGLGGKLKNTFFTGNFDKAVALLTDPEQKLPFSAGDTARVVMEKDSQAATWREQILKAGVNKSFEKSLGEVLDQMRQRRELAETEHQELETKSEHIAKYMAGLQQRFDQASRTCDELAKAGGPFSAAEVGKTLLPAARADMQAKANDPVSTYDQLQKGTKLGESAGRMVGEAEALLSCARDTREKLLPALEHAHAAVQGVSLEWADSSRDQLSARLDQAAQKATRGSAAEEIKAVSTEVGALLANLKRVEQLDADRRGAAADELAAVKAEVQTARQELTHGLQQLGMFAQAGEVLPETDPCTGQARILLDQAGPLLSHGSLDSAAETLTALRAQLTQARQLVAQTRQALADYPQASSRREERHAALTSEVHASLERVDQTYAARVQPLAARDVKAGETLTGCVEQADGALGEARGHLDSGRQQADRAQLLQAMESLQASDAGMETAAGQLELLRQAEKLLATMQQDGARELETLTGRLTGLKERSASIYVRAAARELLEKATAQLETARAAVAAKPQDPYTARAELAKARALQDQVQSTMDSDQQIFDRATAQIALAGQQIEKAAAEVAAGEVRTWNVSVPEFGPVQHAVDPSTLEQARQQLAAARSQHQASQGQMPGQSYEEALRLGQESSGSATGSSASTASVVARFQAEFDQKVATAKKQVEMDHAVPALEGRLAETAGRTGHQEVRDPARQLLAQAQTATHAARQMIGQKDRHPYDEEKKVQQAEGLRVQTESAVEADHKACQAARTGLESAGAAVDKAARELSQAESKTFRQQVSGYGEVSLSVNGSELSSARSQLSSAREQVASGQRQQSSKHYEEALREAQSGSGSAASSSSSTAGVLSKTDSAFRQMVAVAERQVEVEKELSSVESRFGSTRGRLNESYVRSQTQSKFQSASRELEEARSLVKRRPPQPDPGRQAVSRAESSRSAVDAAIEADKRAYEQARSKIGSAESAVDRARSAVSRAGNERWSTSVDGHGSVSYSMDSGSLSSARSQLSSAESSLSGARSALSSKDYEEASRRAGQADSEASSADSAADSAVSSGKRHFDSLVSDAREEVRRKREAEERKRREEQEARERAEREARERREAEERRQREARQAEESRRQASSGGSGSHGGSWNGGGGSGSTGGAW